MLRHRLRDIFSVCFLLVTLVLTACGGGGGESPTSASAPSIASASNIAIAGTRAGVTAFIGFVSLNGSSLDRVVSVRFRIKSKPAAQSAPVDASYSIETLRRRGYAEPRSGQLTLPVFGLYAGYANEVTVDLGFTDGSNQKLMVGFQTPPYIDPNQIYDRPVFLKPRGPGDALGFSYFVLKSIFGTPIVIDTDGEVRWLAKPIGIAYSSTFTDGGFVIGDPNSTALYRLELDGSVSQSTILMPTVTGFHHNIDPGKFSLLGEFNTSDGQTANLETVLAEFTSSGAVIQQWDLAALIGDYMRRNGDDPSAFVRPGIDWFHMNAATYDHRDDSLIVSSRENFVVKIDYHSGDIVWIFGDPTKYWYTFASLRAKALHLEAGGLYPIGQHATSITSDGLLLLFNDGAPSFNSPAGASVGESRTYSAVTAYQIDPGSASAKEVWRYDAAQSILSDICSSAYETATKSILIDYAAASHRATVRLVGLDPDHRVAFDFEYRSPTPCASGWQAQPIAFDAMHF
jgi:hypothetical protein